MTQLGTVEYKGQTIPHVIYPTLPKYAPMQFKDEKERAEYNRLVYNVKKVLPWAKLAKLTIIETYEYLETLPTRRAVTSISRPLRPGSSNSMAPRSKSSPAHRGGFS